MCFFKHEYENEYNHEGELKYLNGKVNGTFEWPIINVTNAYKGHWRVNLMYVLYLTNPFWYYEILSKPYIEPTPEEAFTQSNFELLTDPRWTFPTLFNNYIEEYITDAFFLRQIHRWSIWRKLQKFLKLDLEWYPIFFFIADLEKRLVFYKKFIWCKIFKIFIFYFFIFFSRYIFMLGFCYIAGCIIWGWDELEIIYGIILKHLYLYQEHCDFISSKFPGYMYPSILILFKYSCIHNWIISDFYYTYGSSFNRETIALFNSYLFLDIYLYLYSFYIHKFLSFLSFLYLNKHLVDFYLQFFHNLFIYPFIHLSIFGIYWGNIIHEYIVGFYNLPKYFIQYKSQVISGFYYYLYYVYRAIFYFIIWEDVKYSWCDHIQRFLKVKAEMYNNWRWYNVDYYRRFWIYTFSDPWFNQGIVYMTREDALFWWKYLHYTKFCKFDFYLITKIARSSLMVKQ